MSNALERIQGWLDQLIQRLGEGNLLWTLAAVAVVLVVAFLLFQTLRLLLRRGAARIEAWKGTRLPALRFQHQDVLSEEETAAWPRAPCARSAGCSTRCSSTRP
ncbi:MAG: hypothetical protein JRS35_05790 [Deltaproteobacteria bacterium]|nr:hypothetical protein [Deltaproteobacteria bacterium]